MERKEPRRLLFLEGIFGAQGDHSTLTAQQRAKSAGAVTLKEQCHHTRVREIPQDIKRFCAEQLYSAQPGIHFTTSVMFSLAPSIFQPLKSRQPALHDVEVQSSHGTGWGSVPALSDPNTHWWSGPLYNQNATYTDALWAFKPLCITYHT